MGLVVANGFNFVRRLFSSRPHTQAPTSTEIEAKSLVGQESDVNLRALHGRYLKHLRSEGFTKPTLVHKKKEIADFLSFLEDADHSLDATALTTENIVDHLNEMESRGLAVETRRTRRRAIRAWCEWLVDFKIITSSPAWNVKPIRGPRVRKKFLTEAQFQLMLDRCNSSTLTDTRRTAMLWLLITTGLRRNEIWLLEVDDLEWNRGRIFVRNGKGQTTRYVPFSPLAKESMQRYLDQRKHSSEPYLWVNESGPRKLEHIRYHSLGTDIKRLANAAGVQYQDVFHIFRRTWAANAIRNNVPRAYIMKMAGWKTPHMIELYTAALLDEEEDAMEAFHGLGVFSHQKNAPIPPLDPKPPFA